MASKAERQTVLLISVIGVSMIEMQKLELGPAVLPVVQQVYSLSEDILAKLVMKEYKSGSDYKWVMGKLGEWDKELANLPVAWGLYLLVSISFQILDNLLFTIKNKEKLQLINSLFDPLSKLTDFFDERGVNYPVLEEANILVSKLYKLIEFNP